MHKFNMPVMLTEEEVYLLRKEVIKTSGAYNIEQALKWFEEDTDLDLIWIDISDVYGTLGLKTPMNETGKGWLYKGNEPPLMELQLPNGKKYIEIECFNNCAIGWNENGEPDIIIDWPFV